MRALLATALLVAGSFIAEGSPLAAQTGFTGIALNFSTSVPDPGEEVPETYC